MRFDFLFKILLAVVLFCAISSVAAMAAVDTEAPGIDWQKLLSGSGYEYGRSVQQTADGGYVLLGYSSSSASGDVAGTNHGYDDLWVVKLDAEAPDVSLVPGGTGVPADTDGDGLYDDVNGNGRIDFADVVWLFNDL